MHGWAVITTARPVRRRSSSTSPPPLNVLEGQFITPTVAGHRLALSPVAVFLSILLWGWMWGVVGILIAVPLLVCIKLVSDSVSSLRPLSEFLGR